MDKNCDQCKFKEEPKFDPICINCKWRSDEILIDNFTPDEKSAYKKWSDQQRFGSNKEAWNAAIDAVIDHGLTFSIKNPIEIDARRNLDSIEKLKEN